MSEIFDEWPEIYDQWFETPIGSLVRKYENELVLEMLRPDDQERILDAGCGTGIFTQDVLSEGAHVVGLELSLPMIMRARKKFEGYPFHTLQGDMKNLPFTDNSFEKAISVTAIEFILDARGAIGELFRITKPGGCIVVATLNSFSPWANRRKEAGKKEHPIFKHAIFRSPDQMRALSPVEGLIKTAIHFEKHDDPELAKKIEMNGQSKGLITGAFLVARWEKPTEAQD